MIIKILYAKIFNISFEEAGQRIDNFLRKKFKKVPRGIIYKNLRKGNIRVNEKNIKPKYKIVHGDKVRVPSFKIIKNKKTIISPNFKKLTELSNAILYEDDHILILNKPAYIAVHGGSGLSLSVIDGLRTMRPDANFLELVHRLDRDTSGVLIIAKKRSALCSLHEQLRKNEMKKDYLALVRGHWQSHLKVVHAPLLKSNSRYGKKFVQVNKEGKISETHFKIEEFYMFATLMRCIPITGRTHQIRVHTQYAGHPIAFDNLYGDDKFDKQLTHTGLSRLFLHAIKLKFTHPNTGKLIHVKAPMDNQLKNCLQILRKSIRSINLVT